MLATGGLLISATLLTLAVLAPIFHRSDPPRWTTRGWIGELVTVSIVCGLALGLVYFGAGAIAAMQTGPSYLDLGLLAVVLVAAVAIWRMLKAPRTKALEPVAGGAVHAAGAASGATASSPSPHKAA
jgi:choline-glycine betaine transporter